MPVPAQYLSDHVHQTMQFSKVTPDRTKKLFTVTVSCANLLDRCRSVEGFKNNPWYVNETFDEYYTRKEKQLDRLLNILQGKTGGFFANLLGNNESAKDAMLLQEVDIFLNRLRGDETPQQTEHLNRLKTGFITKLNGLGYELLMTSPPPRNSGAKQQALAIIYNRKTLRFTGEARGILDYNGDREYRGFECLFEPLIDNKPSGDRVALASIHLKYGKDYSEAIPAYQRGQIAKDIFTVAGGDSNHVPNLDIIGALADYNTITNIQADNQGKQTGNHEATNRPKCYDVFFMNPDSKNRAHCIEIEAEEFKKDEKTQIYQIVRQNFTERRTKNPDSLQHLSPVGLPWAKGAQPKIVQSGTATTAAKAPLNVPAAAGPAAQAPVQPAPAAAGIIRHSSVFQQPNTIDLSIQHGSLVINFNNAALIKSFCRSFPHLLVESEMHNTSLHIDLTSDFIKSIDTQGGKQLTLHLGSNDERYNICLRLGLTANMVTLKDDGKKDWEVTFTIPPEGLRNQDLYRKSNTQGVKEGVEVNQHYQPK